MPTQTGLCVYEVDDPALRDVPHAAAHNVRLVWTDYHTHSDDPNIDENTRLRNRIAELESLVRELRGMHIPILCAPLQAPLT